MSKKVSFIGSKLTNDTIFVGTVGVLFIWVTLITDKNRQEPTRTDKRHFIY